MAPMTIRHRASTVGKPWSGKIGSTLTGLSGITAGSTGGDRKPGMRRRLASGRPDQMKR